ncbi:putative bifunctional diguanylate cyclase/phosphodiesterase [Kineococcus terrestris]|uniref:putative bifunctional diguanylate cyclase/phosphodiesterase n=1 Tax=Kineococcus terrestris TaxID=2044856 RepID=UPI0034DB6F4F
MATAPSPLPAHAGPAVASPLYAALGALLALLALTRGGHVEVVLVASGVAALLTTAAALVLLRAGTNSRAYAAAGAAWGTAVALAGTWPHTDVAGLSLAQLLVAAGTLGPLLVVLRLLRDARAGTDDPPLLVDALMLATALATVGWDAFTRSGHHGGTGWTASTVLTLTATALLAGSATALAVEHPRLRAAAVGLSLLGVGTALAGICFHHERATAHVAVVVALAGGTAGLLLLPRAGIVQHGGEAAARAARRLETASLVPGPILLVDLVLLVLSPRSDPVLFALYISVLVAYTVRHAATARAVDRSYRALRERTLRDELTGLGNRTALQDALTQPDREQALVLLELTGLDDVNDVLGVRSGDAVVRAAADRLVRVLAGPGGTAYRTGRDEVAVLLPGGTADALRHVDALAAAVAEAPAAVDGAARFPLLATAGVSSCPLDAPGDPMAPLVRADIALRDARRLGPGGVSVYSGDVAAAHARRSLLRERLSVAVRDGLVAVHYQPVVSFTTGRVAKLEALARWDDPVLGRVNPAEFVAVAEESNLVVALGEHVLRTAVRDAAAIGVFAAGVGLAVNVSVVQLQSPGFADVVRDILAAHDVDPALLTLELTESVFLDTDSPAERVVTELARLGCRIAIDDFGTGYSAFGYLGRLPVHVLKIDRSLTRSVTEDGTGQSVLTCVVDLANRLGLTTVVEGVETAEQAAVCRSVDAPLGQGWLYAPAVPLTDVPAQLARVHPVPGSAQPVAG